MYRCICIIQLRKLKPEPAVICTVKEIERGREGKRKGRASEKCPEPASSPICREYSRTHKHTNIQDNKQEGYPSKHHTPFFDKIKKSSLFIYILAEDERTNRQCYRFSFAAGSHRVHFDVGGRALYRENA